MIQNESSIESTDSQRLLTVVHDMRTPLATISAAAELLEQLVSEGDGSYLVKVIRRQAARLELMYNDLACESGLTQQGIRAEQYTELVSLTSEVITEYRVLRPSRRYVFEPAAEAVWVRIDAAGARRILQNLLDNAAAYSAHETSICVRLYRDEEGDVAVMEVEDEGPGVPDALKKEIFEPFIRIADSPREGQGLGLYIVKCLATAGGGHAWVEDGSAGALFKVSLPVLQSMQPMYEDPG